MLKLSEFAKSRLFSAETSLSMHTDDISFSKFFQQRKPPTLGEKQTVNHLNKCQKKHAEKGIKQNKGKKQHEQRINDPLFVSKKIQRVDINRHKKPKTLPRRSKNRIQTKNCEKTCTNT